jgi:eukaryotic-like serine/threonine-protein kinase
MRPEPGKVVAGRYRLERPLASGGMGTIWEATHLQLEVLVAVKFVSDEVTADASTRRRFEREAKAAARLQSAHVVRAYDYGVEGGTPYLAMELLTGESLETRLQRVGRIPLDEAAEVLRHVARGLSEAHDLGIVHRDLKPANIFLARAGQEEVAKVLDFGIAKDTQRQLIDDNTGTGTLLGTPRHMSPEQARGGDIDARSDLWSLGVVMFRALTGRRPFDGKNMADLMASIFADPIPIPSDFAPELGADVDAFFEKALARNPELRFQSALEMADAFDVIAGRPAAPRLARVAPATGVVPRSDATRTMMTADTEVTTTGTTTGVAASRVERRSGRRLLTAMAVVVLAGVASFAWWSRRDQLAPLGEPASAAVTTDDEEPATPAAEPAVTASAPPAATAEPAPTATATASAPSRTFVPQRPPPAATARPKSDDPFFD